MPVESVVPIGSQFGELRIAVRDQAGGSFQLGPVVMRYGNFSETRPEWTYGGGYLWLYDVGTQFISRGPKLPGGAPDLADHGADAGDRSRPCSDPHRACRR